MCSFTIDEFEELFNYKISEKDKKIIYCLEYTLLASSVCFAVMTSFYF